MPSRRSVIVGTGTALTVALAGCIGDDDGGDVAEPPETDFSSQEVNTPDDPESPRTVEISVTGGDSFDSSAVFVQGEEITSDHDGAAWYELDEETEEGDEVSDGAAIEVAVSDGDTFRIDLEWEHEDHDESFTIYRVLGQDAEDPDE